MCMKKEESHCEHKKNTANKREFLDNPARRGDLPPEELLKILPIKQADTMVDLGAGTGYFSIPFAKTFAEFVYALDNDAGMLDIIRMKATEEKVANVEAIKGQIDDIPLPDDSVDFALASLVLHEVKDVAHALQQIKRILKNEGYFMCIELEKLDHPSHNAPRISSTKMEQEMVRAGFKITELLNPTDSIYIIIARK
ncbi:MAG TPA: class I SAM-dependent methyltransferase [Virgibacillus sp.]|nr:class I SAM-dependent methyltransferase [Virgibacillus sp.]